MTDIKNLEYPLQNHFEEFERDIIKLMCERLGKICRTKHGDVESYCKLQNATEDFGVIEKKKSEMIDKTEPELYNIIEGYARDYYEEASKRCIGQLISFEQNYKVKKIVEQTKKEVFKSLQSNLNTVTMGLINDKDDFMSFQPAYVQILNAVISKMATRQFGTDEIIKGAIESLSEHGLTVRKTPVDGKSFDRYKRNIGASFAAEFRYLLTQMNYEIAEVLI